MSIVSHHAVLPSDIWLLFHISVQELLSHLLFILQLTFLISCGLEKKKDDDTVSIIGSESKSCVFFPFIDDTS